MANTLSNNYRDLFELFYNREFESKQRPKEILDTFLKNIFKIDKFVDDFMNELKSNLTVSGNVIAKHSDEHTLRLLKSTVNTFIENVINTNYKMFGVRLKKEFEGKLF